MSTLTLTLVSLKDRGADELLTTDDKTYLGVALQDFDADLVGLDDVLVAIGRAMVSSMAAGAKPISLEILNCSAQNLARRASFSRSRRVVSYCSSICCLLKRAAFRSSASACWIKADRGISLRPGISMGPSCASAAGSGAG